MTQPSLTDAGVRHAAERAANAVPPAFPLDASVAVNPFLGQTGERLETTAARLGRVAGVGLAPPRPWISEQIAAGRITDSDLRAALRATPAIVGLASIGDLKQTANAAALAAFAPATVADLAAEVSGVDWPGVIAERIGAWAAGYFDQGQALWAAPRGRSAYAAWRAVATHDLTLEIAGLAHFATFVSEAPEHTGDVLLRASQRLSLSDASCETYFHQLLMTMGGVAQYARYLGWRAGLEGKTDRTLQDLLAIRLLFEEALFLQYEGRIALRWHEAKAVHAAPVTPSRAQILDAALQEAADRAGQRELASALAHGPAAPRADARPSLQAAFCIDVRSEVFRRALERLDPSIETLGFAGFFGLTAAHRRFASDVEEWRLPALLAPGLHTTTDGAPAADFAARIRQRAARAWGRFKLAAVSSFAFVEATGPLYAVKLTKDALALPHDHAPHDPPPRLETALDPGARVVAAEQVLRAMSLTKGFARLVLLVGHGANVVNTPHASSLHCGACGGQSGEVNARLLARLLNEAKVRDGLAASGIVIPEDTLFVGGLHDTTTDAVTLYTDDHPSPQHAADLAQAQAHLAQAGRLAGLERAQRTGRAGDEAAIQKRSRDWSEVRPEWGLAGCQAFIAAPRRRTRGKDLAGRVFLHDYDWTEDAGFKVLELILTAPVVVASWISLQYFGSVVAPEAFGGGNKLLHNVVGGIGVLEGAGGLMRAGLPWQSVHDGSRLVHEPLRLTVCVEAPREAISDILGRHPEVRALFDNRWLHLFALDEAGRMAWRYAGDLSWTDEGDVTAPQPLLEQA